jgi:hypothetical protein
MNVVTTMSITTTTTSMDGMLRNKYYQYPYNSFDSHPDTYNDCTGCSDDTEQIQSFQLRKKKVGITIHRITSTKDIIITEAYSYVQSLL